MTKIYLVVGYDYEYSNIRVAYRNKEMAETLADALNECDSTYVYKVQEIGLA
ncbi:hypothetical protein LCGC14_2135010 [marine sediment metagenome]|uniref:Uncharacterized protein n=1 Tax=marine sediment metagenome TaxID=412755 RepID=A0A0F9EMF6_9ZZZZ